MHDLTGNKQHSAIFTPIIVATQMARELLKNWQPGQSILDPTCGSGNLLVACAEVLLERGFDAADIAAALHGYDIQEDYVSQCRERLKTLLGANACIEQQVVVKDFLAP